MKALVTGATGFIGSCLVRELLKDNVEVRAMVREKSDTRNIDGLDIEKVNGDIRDADSMMAALKGIEVFYQNAGLYTYNSPEKLYHDINIEGVKIALNAALKTGVPKVIHTSSVVAIGATNGVISDERTEWNPEWDRLKVPYITTKHLGELAALEFCKKGLPVVIVNPAGVIGVRDIKPTPTGQNIVDVLNKKFPGYPDGGTNFVDVEDVARGHILAAQKGKIGERYILGNANLKYKDFMNLVTDVAGMPPITRRIPAGMLIALGYTYQIIAAITRNPPMMKANTARSTCMTVYFNPSKAVKELGMPQTPIRTTIEKAVNWFRENGYVKAK